jgi:predicted nucleic-acid-binding protein
VIGVDTNILVRFIMQDDPAQTRIAERFLTSLTPDAPGHVSMVTLMELVWVLSETYGATRVELANALGALLETKSLVVEQAGSVDRALVVFKAGKADLADALILELDREAGCRATMTFDKAAVKQVGMKLLT